MSDPLSPRASVRARVVFDTFRSRHDPLLAAWLSFRAQVLPGAELPPAGPMRSVDGPTVGGVFGVWRLLASNNRELARGTDLSASPDRARAAVELAQTRSVELAPATVRGSSAMRHGWSLRLDGEPVLMCARWYESPGEAAAAARSVRTVLAGADIALSVTIGTRSGRRHRHGALDLVG
ncbi:hypothetical protein ACFWZW_14965 [Microbacterium enclense]|uniref:hypothetical protein n=1 Tax=Microbacterium enclense TaxID=993073 RepID=UPI0036D8A0BE